MFFIGQFLLEVVDSPAFVPENDSKAHGSSALRLRGSLWRNRELPCLVAGDVPISSGNSY